MSNNSQPQHASHRVRIPLADTRLRGVTTTPDGRTLFVNIQHPGESTKGRNDPTQPSTFSTWPSGVTGARPRSATVVIRKKEGGIIGS